MARAPLKERLDPVEFIVMLLTLFGVLWASEVIYHMDHCALVSIRAVVHAISSL